MQLSKTVFLGFTHSLAVLFKKTHDQFDGVRHQLCLRTTHLILPSSDCHIPSVGWLYFLSHQLASACIFSRCSFWARWSGTAAHFSDSRVLLCHLVLSNLLPSSPTHSWTSRLFFEYENSGPGETLSSLGICWVWDRMIRCCLKCIQKEKENF